jgi:phosphate acetyltransferase
MKKAIFIAATGQNVGKTTLCLGILAALRKRFSTIGFIKPVGQQHVKIDDSLNVDKDVVLFKEHFHLPFPYANMSPVILPSGFTRNFLNGQIDEKEIQSKISFSFDAISQKSSYTIVEGTGHIGVGSIIQLNNAKVAALLGLDVVIIASGGLGSAYDELALNVAMCQQYGVKVRGVILNRVLDEKRAMIEEYFPKCLKNWNIPLIGCVPYSPFLNSPTLKDFEVLFKTSLIAGEKHHYRHFQHHRLVAGSLDAYHDESVPDELIITPASREDIIFATLQRYQKASELDSKALGGMILTGRHAPSDKAIEAIRAVDMPSLYAPLCSYDAMKMITSLIAKIRLEDTQKIEQAIRLVESHINLDLLLNNFGC